MRCCASAETERDYPKTGYGDREGEAVSKVLGDGSLMPPFLMPFGCDLIFDVVFRRKSIFVYFDRTAFAEFVTEAADGKFVLKPGGQVDHEYRSQAGKGGKALR